MPPLYYAMGQEQPGSVGFPSAWIPAEMNTDHVQGFIVHRFVGLSMHAIGVDIGGSGVRIARVNTQTGEMVTEPTLLHHTPSTSAPAILDALSSELRRFPNDLPVGIGFPGVVQRCVVETAPNLGSTWPGIDLSLALGHSQLSVINDADAAAVAEHRWGASNEVTGTVLTVTVGTGLGTALHRHGVLVPNLELGILPHPTHGGRLEDRASGRAKSNHSLSLKQWANRFQEVLQLYEMWLNPDLIVVGGGITDQWEAWAPMICTRAEVRKARFGRYAGLIGAALITAVDDEAS